MKPPLCINSVSTKVSEEEFVDLERRARARAELLEPRGGESGVGTEVLLGYVLALRTILMNLLSSISNGKAVMPSATAKYTLLGGVQGKGQRLVIDDEIEPDRRQGYR